MSPFQQSSVDQARVVFEFIKARFVDLVISLKDSKWEQLPLTVVKHMMKNPGQTVLRVLFLVIMAVPGLIATSFLTAFGFGAGGITAGSVAASVQSVFGTPLWFSFLQSAGAGGWGIGAVGSALRIGTLISSSLLRTKAVKAKL